MDTTAAPMHQNTILHIAQHKQHSKHMHQLITFHCPLQPSFLSACRSSLNGLLLLSFQWPERKFCLPKVLLLLFLGVFMNLLINTFYFSYPFIFTSPLLLFSSFLSLLLLIEDINSI